MKVVWFFTALGQHCETLQWHAQERLQAEGAEQPEAAEAMPGLEDAPAAKSSEPDPFGLDQIIQKEEATK